MITKNKIKYIKSLVDNKSRLLNGLFVVEGERTIKELINSDMIITQIYTTSYNGFENEFVISYSNMKQITCLKTPSSMLALVEMPKYQIPKQISGLSIMLDEVQDPGNLGTIIRIADWYGIENIFCSLNSANCFSPKVVQATMGAISRVKVHYVLLEGVLEGFKGEVWGTFLDGSNSLYQTDKTSDDIMLVMGNEGKGISQNIEKYIQKRVFIAPYPADAIHVESLNVAVATSIVVAEIRRKS